MRRILAFEIWQTLLPVLVRIQAFWYRILILCILTVFTQNICTAQYLPLSGGILTGHLAGTTANFGTSLNAGAAMTPANNAVALTLGSESNSANGNSVRLSFVHKIPLGGAIWTNAAIDAITHDATSSAYGSLGFSTMHATTLSEKMRITSDGKIGIGTSTPVSSLHLSNWRAIQTIQATGDHASLSLIAAGNGGGGAPSVYLSRGEDNLYGAFIVERGTDGGNAPIFSGGNSTDVILGSKAAVPLKFGVNGDVKMTVGTGGNVGIGTVTPEAKLDVTESPGNNVIAAMFGPTSNSSEGNSVRLAFKTKIALSGTTWVNAAIDAITTNVTNSVYGSLAFSTMNATTMAERMRITNEGNVGIGTTDPQGYKLAVNGNMIAESVKVKLHGNWPDYVFEPSYKLPALVETEKFIKENKHLPGIPSAKEVENDGINLGEMNAKLLQKIEELTLYLISQDKKLKEQNLRIKVLEKGRSKNLRKL